MSNAVLLRAAPMRSAVPAVTKWVVAASLAGWFMLVILLGARGAFVGPPGTPPFAIMIGFVAPILVFFAGLRWSRSFRDFVLGVDPRVMMGLQAWRFGGLGFLALYANGILPGSFAIPAGLGDMAIGVTAPWLLAVLIRQPAFTASRTFVVWNALGVLDLLVAVTTGALGSILAAGVAGEVTTGPMALLPLVLIPAYLVPLFIMLHVAAFFQARRLAGQGTEQAQ